MVKYIPGLARNFVIMSDLSDYGRKKVINENRGPVEKAAMQYAANPENPTFTAEYREALTHFPEHPSRGCHPGAGGRTSGASGRFGALVSPSPKRMISNEIGRLETVRIRAGNVKSRPPITIGLMWLQSTSSGHQDDCTRCPLADLHPSRHKANVTHDEIQAATVATDTWQYGGSDQMPVRIICLTFDYWYAIAEADQQLAEGERPEPLGEHGLLYYAYFVQIDGPAFPTVIQAKGFAQSKVQSEIRWN